ncbi:MAG: type III pantothenate kinase [Alistipes sp.]|nr:type III pantothenate kinase [Candidatus Alistipes equi]
MNLVVDIGNSRVKVAVIDGDDVIFDCVFDSICIETIEDIISRYDVRKLIVCSVRRDTRSTFLSLKKKVETYLFLDYKTPLPIQIRYQTYETLGMDRVAMAVGASSLYEVRSAILVDMGTAMTIDILLDGCFMGGNISPGVEMRLKSLHEYTSMLPKVDAELQEDDSLPWGTSTQDAILKGVMHGIASEIEGMRDKLKAVAGDIPVILAGGGAKLFVNRIKNAIFADANIVCVGLNKILEFNAKNS